jgi:hypothetical protein
MDADGPLRDGEAETCATSIPDARFLDAVKAVKDAGDMLGGDAGAAIGNLDADLVVGIALDVYGDRSACRREFHGVMDDID